METKLSIPAIVALITAFHDDTCYKLDVQPVHSFCSPKNPRVYPTSVGGPCASTGKGAGVGTSPAPNACMCLYSRELQWVQERRTRGLHGCVLSGFGATCKH